jgi:ABC-type nitrate/sulfonate/bicarbonate transport system permease component
MAVLTTEAGRMRRIGSGAVLRLAGPGRKALVGLILPAVILLLWQFVAPLFFSDFQLPPPGEVLSGAAGYVWGAADGSRYSGTFLADLGASAQRVLGGFVAGSALGIPLGLMIGFLPRAAAVVEPTISLLRSVPGIAWLPLALIWFGFGSSSAIFLIALGSFFPVCLSTAQGVRFVEPNLVLASRTLGASRLQAIRTVALPAAIPSILNGLRLGLAYSWIYMILGEFTGVNTGLGAALLTARESLRTDIIISLMLIIGLLGIITDWPVQKLLGRIFRTDVR